MLLYKDSFFDNVLMLNRSLSYIFVWTSMFNNQYAVIKPDNLYLRIPNYFFIKASDHKTLMNMMKRSIMVQG